MSDTITGALIGGSIALVGLIFAKEGKTSEFRQQWIDGLRADIATVISLSLKIGQRDRDDGEEVLNTLSSANECLARIQLRLNPTEDESKVLFQALNDLSSNAKDRQPPAILNAFARDATNKAQVVLKKEWKRVKRGEWRYITTLGAAVVAIATSIGYTIYHHWH